MIQDLTRGDQFICFCNNNCTMSLDYAISNGCAVYDFNQIDFSGRLSNNAINKAAMKECFKTDLNADILFKDMFD